MTSDLSVPYTVARRDTRHRSRSTGQGSSGEGYNRAQKGNWQSNRANQILPLEMDLPCLSDVSGSVCSHDG